jgi:hypothetical protein
MDRKGFTPQAPDPVVTIPEGGGDLKVPARALRG